MMTPEKIHDALQDRRLDKVAQATGVSYNTIRKIRDDAKINPTWKTISLLSKYFEEREAE